MHVGDVRIRVLTALAVPFVADAGIPRRRAHARHHAARRRARGCALVHARRSGGGPPGAAAGGRHLGAAHRRLVQRRRRTAAPPVAADVFVSPRVAHAIRATGWWSRRIATNSMRARPRRSRRGPTSTGVIGGRDLQAGGAWFAVDTRRRFGIVTNFREFGRRRRSAPVARRAHTGVPRAGRTRPASYLRRSKRTRPGYAGLQPAARRPRIALVRVESRRPVRARVAARNLRPVQRVPRHAVAEAGPRARALRRAAASRTRVRDPAALDCRACSPCSRTARRRRPTTLPPGDLSPEWARKLSAPFVLDPAYGTRCSTVLTISTDGALRIAERRFDARGARVGTV